MSFMNTVIDILASQDVLDLYFVLSDLIDIPISEAESCETAYFDAMASATVNETKKGRKTPIGKLVL